MERIVIYNVICKATLYNSSFPNVRFTYVHVYRRYSVSQLVNYSIDHPIPVYTCICISHLKPLILHIESIYTLLAYRVNIYSSQWIRSMIEETANTVSIFLLRREANAASLVSGWLTRDGHGRKRCAHATGEGMQQVYRILDRVCHIAYHKSVWQPVWQVGERLSPCDYGISSYIHIYI